MKGFIYVLFLATTVFVYALCVGFTAEALKSFCGKATATAFEEIMFAIAAGYLITKHFIVETE